MEKVKHEIFSNVENVPEVSFMRLIEFYNSRLTRICSDNKTFGKNAGGSLKHYKVLCCQKTATANESFISNGLLFNVARWNQNIKKNQGEKKQ